MITTTPLCGAICKRGILQKWHRKGCYNLIKAIVRTHVLDGNPAVPFISTYIRL